MAGRSIAWVAASMALIAALCCVDSVLGDPGGDSKSLPRRILFIGNSYTAQIQGALQHMLANSPYKSVSVEFITKGGATLQRHLKDEKTLNRIKTGNWDYVVLQEQSQTPALPGKHEKSFHDAVDTFTSVIRGAGAEPVLYVTWGRRDGDKQNKEAFPDYDTMQQKLSDAYRSAARKNRLTMANVGQAWSIVREKDKALGRALYKTDGSHPSSKGAFLASCVFFRALFNDSLESVQAFGGLEQREVEIIKTAVLMPGGLYEDGGLPPQTASPNDAK